MIEEKITKRKEIKENSLGMIELQFFILHDEFLF